MVDGMGDRTSLPTLGGEYVPGTSFTAPFYDDDGVHIIELLY